MSGLVAGRLYSLLPPQMPLNAKYALTEGLWKKFSPRSHKVLRIGPDANPDEVIEKVQSHIISAVVNYTIPEPMEKRFNWLSMGDVAVKQQLLNHLLDVEKSVALAGTREQMPIMIQHMQQHGSVTHRLKHSIEIGKHKFDLEYDTQASGVRFEEPRPISPVYRAASQSTSGSYAWLWWVAGIGLITWFLTR